MGFVEILAIITAVVPILTPLIKKLLKTDKWGSKKTTNAIIPLVVGVLGGIIACASEACTVAEACKQAGVWWQCALGGLAAGAGGSYVRDFDKNVLGLAKNGAKIGNVLLGKKEE